MHLIKQRLRAHKPARQRQFYFSVSDVKDSSDLNLITLIFTAQSDKACLFQQTKRHCSFPMSLCVILSCIIVAVQFLCLTVIL